MLAELVRISDGVPGLARWYYHLQDLACRCLLRLSVWADDVCLAALEPTASSFVLPSAAPIPGRSWVLSRFAWIQRRGDLLAVESPLAPARIVLHDARAANLVCALARPGTETEMSRTIGLPGEPLLSLLGLLAHIGAVSAVEEDGTTDNGDPALRYWQFHDLLFHTRSRPGRHDNEVGATYAQAAQFDPPPALKPRPDSEGVTLDRPDLERLQREDPPFALIQERRRSVRHYGTEPIMAGQLGEFLYRVARVKGRQRTQVATPRGPVAMDVALRPYPAGGALHELEIYVVVQACQGLAPGVYEYDGLAHRLLPRPERCSDRAGLLTDAALAAGITSASLQILLVITARLPRLAWKYSGLAYALVLKHVGVVYQTMYLAATAMGLAPCALGTGDSDRFARAASLDYYAETSVGEFLLGSAPDRNVLGGRS